LHRIENQIDSAMIVARADFVKVNAISLQRGEKQRPKKKWRPGAPVL